jgi:hypothetical protein
VLAGAPCKLYLAAMRRARALIAILSVRL